MKGLIYPFTLNAKGGVDWTTDPQELIKSNLKAIMAWPFGNRFFLPEFGTRLNELLEKEPNDSILNAMVVELIIEPIKRFEPRVKVLDWKLESKTDEALNVYISYVITEYDMPDSFSAPFYLNNITA